VAPVSALAAPAHSAEASSIEIKVFAFRIVPSGSVVALNRPDRTTALPCRSRRVVNLGPPRVACATVRTCA
jgi:hypothetical protein